MKKKILSLCMVVFYAMAALPAGAVDTSRNIDQSYWRIKEKTAGMWQDFYSELQPFGKVYCYRNDFSDWIADSWTITEVGTSLQNLKDERNGVLDLTSGGTEDNGNNAQLGGTGDTETTGESFLPANGKNLWFEARIKSNDVTEHDFFVGLSIQDTTVIASAGADLIGFRTDDGDALLDATAANTAEGASNSTGIATLANDTYVKVGFKTTSNQKIEFYVDDTLKATMTASIPVTEMKLTLAQLTGEGNAATLSVDYVVVCQDR